MQACLHGLIPLPASEQDRCEDQGLPASSVGGQFWQWVSNLSNEDEYKVVLSSFPNANTSVNSAFLYCDLKCLPYHIQNFRSVMGRYGVLKEVVALGLFQMNNVWTLALHTPETKRRLLVAKELKMKELRCLIVDPSNAEVRVRFN